MSAEEDIDCRKASGLLSRACERPLQARELRALKRHLDACLMCRDFEQQLRFLRKAARAFREAE